MPFDPTSVDLQRLSDSLQQILNSPIVPGGMLEGKTVLREVTMSLLNCSELEAENVVDTLVARGFVRFRKHRDLPQGAAWFLEGSV
jgi:hypothetical protein